MISKVKKYLNVITIVLRLKLNYTQVQYWQSHVTVTNPKASIIILEVRTCNEKEQNETILLGLITMELTLAIQSVRFGAGV